MEMMSLFTIHFTVLLLFLVLILIFVEIVSFILRIIDKRYKSSERLRKWIDVLDWLNDKDD